jgi:glycosyltransferase involved in cell wall biosynthesis
MLPKKRILFLSSWFPLPVNNGSKLRIYNLLRGLSEYYDVTLISLDNTPYTKKNAIKINSNSIDVITVPYKQYNPQSLKARLGFFSLSPRVFVDTYSHEMARQIKETIADKQPDLIVASQLGTALYQPVFTNLPALFEEVEIGLFYDGCKYAKSYSQRIRNQFTWMKHRRYLVNLLHRYQSFTVVSEREKQLVVNLDLHTIINEVIPNCITVNDYQEFRQIKQSNTLIFTGPFSYYPNYEAMVWFITKVFPQIQSYCPSIRLIITGNHSGLRLPSASNVTLTGLVGDVRPLIAESSVSIVPIFSGGGTRVKILEAMALHTPVVSTQKGAEGLEIENGSNILIADTPEEFSEQIIRLLNNRNLRQKLVSNAHQLVREKYDWTVVMPKFIGLVEKTMSNFSSIN